jgi:outer membrane protein OmpA-like peptidoglycan-associated protein
VLLAATVMSLPIVATAQPINGFYLGAGAGINLMADENVQSITFDGETLGTSGRKLTMNVGPVAVLSAGWGFGNGLRTELEFDYRSNGFSSVAGSGPLLGNFVLGASGSEQKFGPMVNLLYDFNNLLPYLVPYVGAGVGYQIVRVNNFNATLSFLDSGLALTSSGSNGAFAYQAIVGAAVPISAVPGLSVTAEYRFMGLAGNRTNGLELTYEGESAAGSAKVSGDVNHAVLIGVRYAFGAPSPAPAPAPAPMAAPAPAPARSYLVFFDWDKATLTARAQQIIKEAADNSTKVQYTRIEVNGYTDTSGTPQYNQGLSVRRAQAVAAELVKDGVPQGAIAIQGFGETHLLVPTGPGVREPQNRRVEIIIR